jgi:DNA-binding transcriptional MerR regulator
MEGYRTRDVIKLTGIPHSTLHLWVSKGLLTPAISEGGSPKRRDGKDGQRIYSFYNLVELKAIIALREAGVSFQKLMEVKRLDLNTWSYLVSDGSDVFALDVEGLTSLLSEPGQGVLLSIIDLRRIRQGLESEKQTERQLELNVS